jgi:DNA-binding NarL/FixJ family response regulator
MAASSRQIGVLVAEDNRDLCAAICELVAAEPDMQVTASVQRAGELVAMAGTATADVIVLDLDLAGESSIPALQVLRSAQPHVAVVVFSGHDRGALAPLFAQLGACEYVTKTGDVTMLLDAIRRVTAKAAGAGV